MRFARYALLVVSLSMAMILSACSGGVVKDKGPGGKKVVLNGAGSTFVYPLLSKWSAVYEDETGKASVNYQSVGSGGGIRQLIARTVNFGATDGPMTDEQLEEAGEPVFHVPVTMGAVVPAYYLPGLKGRLRLTGPVLADIFLGKIKQWNDPAIKKINPKIKLPNVPIVVVHRSDGSGTTYIWVDYLAKVSKEWKEKVGVATSVNWPAGIGAKGNEGVAGQVGRTAGALGYIELSYAVQNKIPYASVANREGKYVLATPGSVSAAAAAASRSIPEDMRASITDAPGKDAYPISGFTWVVLYRNQKDKKDGQALVGFLWWAVHEGQKYARALDYAPLPREIISRDGEILKKVSADGKSLLKE